MEKRKQLILDIIIGILIIAVIILIDHLIVNWRSSSADEAWPKVNIEDKKGEGENEDEKGTYQIKEGESVFVPILNFHRIDKAPAGADSVTKSFFIEPHSFEEIIAAIIDDDYEPVFASEIVYYLEKRALPAKKIIAITFDDGNQDFYANAWPILQKYKVKASMYIMTGVGGPNYLSQEQIVELDESGLVEFGSHTVWHPKLTKISEEEQRRELADSKVYLEKLLNKEIEIFCYPYGLYNDQLKDLTADVGYKAALTFDQDAWQNPDDLFALTRISVYPGLNVLKFLERLKSEK